MKRFLTSQRFARNGTARFSFRLERPAEARILLVPTTKDTSGTLAPAKT